MKLEKSNINKYLGILKDGIIDNNPVFIQLIGMCPLLAISTSVRNGIGMGISATFVLTFSNLLISTLRNFIPAKIRIASYVVIISGFVTVIDLLLKAYFSELSDSLGLFIPLIVVNCIIFARGESFASKNKFLDSLTDGIGMGLGFTAALFLVSTVREILGSGSWAGIKIFGDTFQPATLLIMPPGGFLIFGLLLALISWILNKRKHGDNKNVS